MFDLANIAKSIESAIGPQGQAAAKEGAAKAASAVGLPTPAEVSAATAATKEAASSAKRTSDAVSLAFAVAFALAAGFVAYKVTQPFVRR